MVRSDRLSDAEALRAAGHTTSQIVARWTHEGLSPLRAARLAHGWSQQQVADHLNADNPASPTTRQTVHRWETGQIPQLGTLNKLARLYKVRAGDLIPGEDWSHLEGPGAGVTALAVAMAIVVHERRVLIVQPHNKLWQYPSGVVKPGQDPSMRAGEECTAETGIRVAVGERLGSRVHPDSGAWCDYYAARYLTGHLINGQPGENSDILWAPLDQIHGFIARNRIFPPVLTYLESL